MSLWIIGWIACGVLTYITMRRLSRVDWSVGDRTMGLLMAGLGPVILPIVLAVLVFCKIASWSGWERPAKW